LLVPHQNVAGLDAGLLQPLGNRHHQRMVRTNALAAQAVDLEANDLASGNKTRGHNPPPRFDRVLAARVSGDGAVEQSSHALLVRLRARSVKRCVTRNHHSGFARLRMLIQPCGQSKLALRAQRQSSRGRNLQKIPSVFHCTPLNRRCRIG
jgi:hypothetical protein